MKDDTISREAALNCVYGTSPNKIKGRIAELPSATDTNVGGMISRQAALDALGERPVVWSDNDDYTLGERNQYDMDRLAIETVPSAQPDVPDTNVGDMISRQAALDAIKKLEKPAPTAQHLSAIFDCEDTIKALPSAQPGWIPVTERLPDKEGSYLCTVQGYVGKTTYLRIADFHPDIYVEYDIEEHKPGFIDYDSEYGFYEVTKVLAWMPLPTPYREG